MTKRVQRIRHNTTGADAFIGRDGEITVDTTKKTLRVHDGLTAGGVEAARADLGNVLSSQITNLVSIVSSSAAGKVTPAQLAEFQGNLKPLGLVYLEDAAGPTLDFGSPGIIPINGTPLYNVNSIIDTANNKVVIPSDVTKVRLTVQLSLEVTANANLLVLFTKNADISLKYGQYGPAGAQPSEQSTNIQFSSPILPVVISDFFEIRHIPSSSTAFALIMNQSWLQVEGL